MSFSIYNLKSPNLQSENGPSTDGRLRRLAGVSEGEAERGSTGEILSATKDLTKTKSGNYWAVD